MSLLHPGHGRKAFAGITLCFAVSILLVACGSSQQSNSDSTRDSEQWSRIERTGRMSDETSDQEQEQPRWELTEDTELNGRLLIINGSDEAIRRVWFSPSDVDDFSVGYEWPSAQQIAAGRTATGPAVEGWWDIWLESEQGNDATIMRVYIKPNAVTRLNVDDAWWSGGDLLGSDLNLSIR